MKKAIVLILFLLTAMSFASDGKLYNGTVTVAFGHVRDTNGKVRSIAGLKLAYKMEAIVATKIHPAKRKIHGPSVEDLIAPKYTAALPVYRYTPFALAAARPALTATVFNADAGDGYGAIDTPDPSSTDDMILQNGAHIPWQNLTFGVDVSDVHTFLIRWICWTNYTEGGGHDVQAFSGTFADFGVIFPANQIPQVGTYKITISVAAAGVVAPQDTMYMAQQYRTPQPDGEGPFDVAMKNVYNPTAPPSVGSSDNVFWYDWDPLDGIYADDEVDNFGDSAYANLLRTITVSGTSDTLVPSTYTIVHGVYASGDITDLWYTDSSYLKILSDFGGVGPSVQLQVNGRAATVTANSFRFITKLHGLLAGGNQVVSLWNYTTSAYDVIDTRTITNSDTTVDVTITNTPTKYINQTTRNIQALITMAPPALRSVRSWFGSVDLTNWVISHP
jgi:hypothetical protein